LSFLLNNTFFYRKPLINVKNEIFQAVPEKAFLALILAESRDFAPIEERRNEGTWERGNRIIHPSVASFLCSSFSSSLITHVVMRVSLFIPCLIDQFHPQVVKIVAESILSGLRTWEPLTGERSLTMILVRFFGVSEYP